MERNKKNLKERGITLVALIITIIVMLILVAVTVTVAVQSNLISTAETATSKYKDSQEDQIDAKNVIVSSGKHDTLEEYVQALCKEHDFVTGEGWCSNCGAENTEKITFTVADLSLTFTAPEGATWRTFIPSKYNTDGFFTMNDTNVGCNPPVPGYMTVDNINLTVDTRLVDGGNVMFNTI